MEIIIDKNQKIPIYIQIAEQIKRQIRQNELLPGDMLPPERKLAIEIGVNRSTILNAYNRLKEEGLLEAKVGQGTVVCSNNNKIESAGNRPSWRQIFNSNLNGINDAMLRQMFQIAATDEIISFAIGIANSKHEIKLPFNSINEDTLLKQSPIAGNYRLRELISKRQVKRGMLSKPEEILILSGSQQGIDLAGRVLIEPGDIVIVEEPSYFLAVQTFRSMGARIIKVPVDKDGMRLKVLEQFIRRYNPKLIYTVPTYHNPSSICMSLEKRKELLRLAYNYDIMIIEDDAYRELDYMENSLPSLAALDTNGYVIYLCTFSKIINQGLRLGYMAADREFISKCSLVRQSVDLHTNTISQALVERYMESGEFDIHIESVCREYKEKMECMHQALTKYASTNMRWSKPLGGYYIWCELPQDVSASKLLNRTLKRKVAFMPGTPFYESEEGEKYIRLNFTYPSLDNIEKGIGILCEEVKKLESEAEKSNIVASTEFIPLF